MKLVGLVRLGRDAEVRFTSTGDPVCAFSGAFNYGRRGDDGQPSQWVEFTLWGSRGEKLAEHLKKGTQLFVVAGEPHVETYEKRDGGTGVKLVARVDDLQFAGPRPESGGEQRSAAPPQRAASAPAPSRAAPKGGGGFDDLDDDIPFITCSPTIEMAGPIARRMRRYGGDL